MAVIIDGDLGIDKIKDGTVTSDDLSSTLDLSSKTITLASGTAGAGKILQVIQTTKTDTFSTTSTTPVDITGFSVSITPSSTSNKILVLCNTYLGHSSFTGYTYLLRDTTQIFVGDTAGTRPSVTQNVGGYGSGTSIDYCLNSASTTYLDSPNTTSQVTYKMQMSTYQAATATYLNRTAADRDLTTYDPRAVSSITVMEIAG